MYSKKMLYLCRVLKMDFERLAVMTVEPAYGAYRSGAFGKSRKTH